VKGQKRSAGCRIKSGMTWRATLFRRTAIFFILPHFEKGRLGEIIY
jgi:hypothetical protein